HERSTQPSVHPVVPADGRDVGEEASGRKPPAQDRKRRSVAHPAESQVLHIGTEVVERRDDERGKNREHWPLADIPYGEPRFGEPDRLRDSRRDEQDRDDRRENDEEGDGERDHEAAELPD